MKAEYRDASYVENPVGVRTTGNLIVAPGAESDSFLLKKADMIDFRSFGPRCLHTHGFAEILLIVSGALNHYVNGSELNLELGDLIFFRPSDSHYLEKAPRKSCEMINLAFKEEYISEISAYLENDNVADNYYSSDLPAKFNLSEGEIRSLGSAMLEIRKLERSDQSAAKTKAKLFLMEMFSSYFLYADPDVAVEGMPGWLADLRKFMDNEKNLCAGISLMVKKAPCTQEYLCRIFRKYLNKTPTQYINEQRIKHIAVRLADPDEQIYSAATDLGFKSMAQFYSLFKAVFNKTPREYRLGLKNKMNPF